MTERVHKSDVWNVRWPKSVMAKLSFSQQNLPFLMTKLQSETKVFSAVEVISTVPDYPA